MSSLLINLSPKQLRRAAGIKEKIQSLEKKLKTILGSPKEAAAPGVPKKRRKMSAAARKKIAAAQKARWAKVKAKK